MHYSDHDHNGGLQYQLAGMQCKRELVNIQSYIYCTYVVYISVASVLDQLRHWEFALRQEKPQIARNIHFLCEFPYDII